MLRLQKLILVIIALTLVAWAPIGYTGLPRTTDFSIRWVSRAGPAIITQDGTYGDHGQAAGFWWNETSVEDYYPIESWSFTNISNVVRVAWDLRATLVKVDDGRPLYDELFQTGPCVPLGTPGPRPPRPKPFSRVDFKVSVVSTKNVTATWKDGVENSTSFGENRYSLSFPHWDSGAQ